MMCERVFRGTCLHEKRSQFLSCSHEEYKRDSKLKSIAFAHLFLVTASQVPFLNPHKQNHTSQNLVVKAGKQTVQKKGQSDY